MAPRSRLNRLAISGGLAAAVVTVAFVAMSATRVGPAPQQPQAGTSIDSGTEWVPLTVEYVRDIGNGKVQHIVKYRTADGSTRLEQIEMGEIQIVNMTKHAYYHLGRNQRWMQAPLRPQPNGGKPFMRLSRNRVTEVRNDDPRVTAMTAAGVAALLYEFVDEGARRVYCPELNMLEVYSAKIDGVTQQLTKLTLGEPAVEFEPPAGADVDVVTTPAGPGVVDSAQ